MVHHDISEGARSLCGKLQPFKQGIGLLAKELNAPVVPIWIDGAGSVLPKGKHTPAPGRVAVRIGRAVQLPEGTAIEDATRILEESVREASADARPVAARQ